MIAMNYFLRNHNNPDWYDRDEEGTVMNVGTDELPESKKEIRWNIEKFPLYKDGTRPIYAKKKRDLWYLSIVGACLRAGEHITKI